MASPVPERLQRLRRLMRQHAVEALLLTSPANRRYFSGFEAGDPQLNESSGALVITARTQYLLTDSRYTEAARTQAPLFQTVTCPREPAREFARLPALKNVRTLFLEPEFLSLAAWNKMKKAWPGRRLAAAPFQAETLRVQKSPEEIANQLNIERRIIDNLIGEMS